MLNKVITEFLREAVKAVEQETPEKIAYIHTDEKSCPVCKSKIPSNLEDMTPCSCRTLLMRSFFPVAASTIRIHNRFFPAYKNGIPTGEKEQVSYSKPGILKLVYKEQDNTLFCAVMVCMYPYQQDPAKPNERIAYRNTFILACMTCNEQDGFLSYTKKGFSKAAESIERIQRHKDAGDIRSIFEGFDANSFICGAKKARQYKTLEEYKNIILNEYEDCQFHAIKISDPCHIEDYEYIAYPDLAEEIKREELEIDAAERLIESMLTYQDIPHRIAEYAKISMPVYMPMPVYVPPAANRQVAGAEGSKSAYWLSKVCPVCNKVEHIEIPTHKKSEWFWSQRLESTEKTICCREEDYIDCSGNVVEKLLRQRCKACGIDLEGHEIYGKPIRELLPEKFVTAWAKDADVKIEDFSTGIRSIPTQSITMEKTNLLDDSFLIRIFNMDYEITKETETQRCFVSEDYVIWLRRILEDGELVWTLVSVQTKDKYILNSCYKRLKRTGWTKKESDSFLCIQPDIDKILEYAHKAMGMPDGAILKKLGTGIYTRGFISKKSWFSDFHSPNEIVRQMRNDGIAHLATEIFENDVYEAVRAMKDAKSSKEFYEHYGYTEAVIQFAAANKLTLSEAKVYSALSAFGYITLEDIRFAVKNSITEDLKLIADTTKLSIGDCIKMIAGYSQEHCESPSRASRKWTNFLNTLSKTGCKLPNSIPENLDEANRAMLAVCLCSKVLIENELLPQKWSKNICTDKYTTRFVQKDELYDISMMRGFYEFHDFCEGCLLGTESLVAIAATRNNHNGEIEGLFVAMIKPAVFGRSQTVKTNCFLKENVEQAPMTEMFDKWRKIFL